MTLQPASPCIEARRWIDADVDRELDALGSQALAAHLADCPECRAQRDALLALRASLREKAPYYRAPEDLRQELRAAAVSPASSPVGITRLPSRLQRFGHWALPLAAGLAFGAMLDRGLPLRQAADPGEAMLATEVADAHLRSLEGGHLADVASTDRHTVKPWFAGKLDYSPPVADFATQGFSLVGGRLDFLADREVAALVYQRREHLINVFVWPAAGGGARLAPVRVYRGYQLLHWQTGGMDWWLASDLNAAELGDFARLLGAPT